MPEGCVYVGRPTRWGNPYRVVQFPNGLWGVVRDRPGGDREYIDNPVETRVEAMASAVEWYRAYLCSAAGSVVREAACSELRGRDLACWCPLARPCHADVLIEIVNAGEGGA